MIILGSLESAYSGLPISVRLIEFFSLGVTDEVIRAVIGSKSAISLEGLIDPKFQIEGVAPTIKWQY